MADISQIPERELRAMADCRAISSARYVDEMERRRRACIAIEEVPPLDYALDAELAIRDIDAIEAVFDDGAPLGPMPKAVAWILAIAVTSVVAIALWMVWP